MVFFFFFFFSSRRRHTRSYGDWSSDVCSSDLGRLHLLRRPAHATRQVPGAVEAGEADLVHPGVDPARAHRGARRRAALHPGRRARQPARRLPPPAEPPYLWHPRHGHSVGHRHGGDPRLHPPLPRGRRAALPAGSGRHARRVHLPAGEGGRARRHDLRRGAPRHLSLRAVPRRRRAHRPRAREAHGSSGRAAPRRRAREPDGGPAPRLARRPARLLSCAGEARRVIDRLFQLRARGTDLRTEVVGGASTFAALSYIVFVQPAVLATTGMEPGAVLAATCLASAFATALMGLWANYPIAVAPAMGHNFYFALVVAGPVAAGRLGCSWQVALGANCIAGVLFLVLSLVGLRARQS